MLNTALQGIVQGLSEFLPISSSGHLTLIQHFTGNNNLEANMTTDIALHFGTLVAVFYYFRKDLIPYFTVAGWKDEARRKIALLVLTASFPTALIGLGLKKYIEAFFQNPSLVCLALFLTGVLLLISEKLKNKEKDNTTINIEESSKPSDLKSDATALSKLTYKSAIITGIAQGIACTPGISRSGSTIVAGLLLGLKGEDAAKFSFLLMIPSVGGATLLEVIKVVKTGSLAEGLVPANLALGAITSLIVGLLSLKFLTYIIKKQKLSYFAYYLFAVSIICISLINFAGM